MSKNTFIPIAISNGVKNQWVHEDNGAVFTSQPIANSLIFRGAKTSNNQFLSIRLSEKTNFDLELTSIIVTLSSTTSSEPEDKLIFDIKSEPDKITQRFQLPVYDPQQNTDGLRHSGNFYIYKFPENIVVPNSSIISYNSSGIKKGGGIILTCKPIHIMGIHDFYEIEGV